MKRSRVWQGALCAIGFGWAFQANALMDSNQGAGEEQKVQRPIGPVSGETVAPGSYSGDLHANTERQIQEWDAKIAALRQDHASAPASRQGELKEGIEELEENKRDIRNELKDLSADIESLRLESQKKIQARFKDMEQELREAREAE